MKTCESRIAREKWNVQCALGIVEVIATSGHGRSALRALEACKDEISPDFLERLAKRPERIVLLQCSCRLGCSGGCECSMTQQGAMTKSIWTKFSHENHKAIWWRTENSNLDENKCSCDGLPRLTTDLVASCRTMRPNLLYSIMDEEPAIFTSLLETDAWSVKSAWKKMFSHVHSLVPEKLLTDSKPCLYALTSIQGLLDPQTDPGRELDTKLLHFGLDLVNYLILNLATQRSFGCLTAYLPKTVQQVIDYLESGNPLKLVLAKLVFMRDEIAEDLDGKKVSAFCIDLANIACTRILPRHYRSKMMNSLGQAMIFATLFGGTVPKVNGGGGGIGSRSGRGGCLEVVGRRLMDYFDFVSWPGLDLFKINPEALYQIRSGGIYTDDGRDEFSGMKLLRLNDATGWCHKIFVEKNQGSPESSIRNASESDALERMEDLYQYRRPSSKGWREMLSYHPYLHDEIERPRVFDRREQRVIPLAYYSEIKRYFNRLPEDEGMKGQRALISSRLIPTSLNARSKIPVFCRLSDESGRSDSPLIAEAVRDHVMRRLEVLKKGLNVEGGGGSDVGDEMVVEAKGVQDRLEQILQEFSSDSEPDGGKLLVNSAAATRACEDLLTDLDDLFFKQYLNQCRSDSLNLFSAESAKHYSLSGKGVKILAFDQPRNLDDPPENLGVIQMIINLSDDF